MSARIGHGHIINRRVRDNFASIAPPTNIKLKVEGSFAASAAAAAAVPVPPSYPFYMLPNGYTFFEFVLFPLFSLLNNYFYWNLFRCDAFKKCMLTWSHTQLNEMKNRRAHHKRTHTQTIQSIVERKKFPNRSERIQRWTKTTARRKKIIIILYNYLLLFLFAEKSMQPGH